MWVNERKCRIAGCFNDAVCKGACLRHVTNIKPKANYSDYRRPRTQALHLGVELECEATESSIYHGLLAQPLRAHHDASVGELGVEYKLLGEPDKVKKRAASLARRLLVCGAVATTRCGFHVHLDARCVETYRRLEFCQWMAQWEDWWFKLIPPSRRDSEFCTRLIRYVRPVNEITGLTDRTLHETQLPQRNSHHAWINASNKSTVEIRLHPGTLNPYKIAGWLEVCEGLLKLLNGKKAWPEIHYDCDKHSAFYYYPAFLKDIFNQKAIDYLRARIQNGGVLKSVTRGQKEAS